MLQGGWELAPMLNMPAQPRKFGSGWCGLVGALGRRPCTCVSLHLWILRKMGSWNSKPGNLKIWWWHPTIGTH